MTTSQPPRGMPILSGPPPVIESSSCRQCAKQFNPLWRRAHTCGHCGYEYCSNCLSDGQALMPRRQTRNGANGSTGELGELRSAAASFAGDIRAAVGLDETAVEGAARGNGYDVESVCLPCLGMLQVTAAPLEILRSLPIKRLKEYLDAYDIPCIGPKEKEDFVQAVIRARNPSTGCLAPEAESYYRRRSVPKHGQTANKTFATNSTTTPAPRNRPSSSTPARPPSSGPSYRPSPPSGVPRQQSQYHSPQQARPPPSYHPQPQRPVPQSRPPAPTATVPKATAVRTPPPPVPTILSLVSLPRSYLSSLSIGTLKAILFDNHVRVDFKQVLEKEELISRVDELVSDERKRLERQRIEEERYAAGASANPPVSNGEADEVNVISDAPVSSAPIQTRNVPTGPMPEVERGLCVVCQDEEATLAVVDCGHLCMCAHCSDLIMATSQECPLCRTRIVTKQRLIRIYRV